MYETSSEFLTGFHKRKQQRVEEKKAKRKEREKQERLEARRQVSAFSFKIGALGGELTWPESPNACGTSRQKCRTGGSRLRG